MLVLNFDGSDPSCVQCPSKTPTCFYGCPSAYVCSVTPQTCNECPVAFCVRTSLVDGSNLHEGVPDAIPYPGSGKYQEFINGVLESWIYPKYQPENSQDYNTENTVDPSVQLIASISQSRIDEELNSNQKAETVSGAPTSESDSSTEATEAKKESSIPPSSSTSSSGITSGTTSETASGTTSETASGTTSETASGTTSETASGTSSSGTTSETAPGTNSLTSIDKHNTHQSEATKQSTDSQISNTQDLFSNVSDTASHSSSTEGTLESTVELSSHLRAPDHSDVQPTSWQSSWQSSGPTSVDSTTESGYSESDSSVSSGPSSTVMHSESLEGCTNTSTPESTGIKSSSNSKQYRVLFGSLLGVTLAIGLIVIVIVAVTRYKGLKRKKENEEPDEKDVFDQGRPYSLDLGANPAREPDLGAPSHRAPEGSEFRPNSEPKKPRALRASDRARDCSYLETSSIDPREASDLRTLNSQRAFNAVLMAPSHRASSVPPKSAYKKPKDKRFTSTSSVFDEELPGPKRWTWVFRGSRWRDSRTESIASRKQFRDIDPVMVRPPEFPDTPPRRAPRVPEGVLPWTQR